MGTFEQKNNIACARSHGDCLGTGPRRFPISDDNLEPRLEPRPESDAGLPSASSFFRPAQFVSFESPSGLRHLRPTVLRPNSCTASWRAWHALRPAAYGSAGSRLPGVAPEAASFQKLEELGAGRLRRVWVLSSANYG